VNLTALYRSLEFILLNTPSFVPFQAFPEEMNVAPELFAALSADYHFPTVGLTPGIQAGVEMPAAVTTFLDETTVGSHAPATLNGEHTIIIRANGRPDILPEGDGRVPLVSVKGSVAWWASDFLTLNAFAFITFDQNATIFQLESDLTRIRVFDDPVRFGAALMAQARF
jgi:hypothetical protein